MTYRIYTRGHAERADDGGEVTFVLSTAGVKRDGLDLDPQRWRMNDYKRNPVLLLNHDYSMLPIGRADVWYDQDANALRFNPQYDLEDPAAVEIKRKVDAGYISAASAGWNFVDEDGRPIEAKRGVAALRDAYYDLLDVSLVTVPGDPSALAERAAAMRAAAAALEAAAGGDDDVTVGADTDAEPDTWARTAADMVAVYDLAGVAGDDADDTDRRRRYNALLPHYRRMGRVPPEWIPARDVSALGWQEWRTIFLEGELMHSRYGAVLSARNRDLLVTARDAIAEVLRGATTETDDRDRDVAPDASRAAIEGEQAGLLAGLLGDVLTMLGEIKSALVEAEGEAEEGETEPEGEMPAGEDATPDEPRDETADTLRAVLAALSK